MGKPSLGEGWHFEPSLSHQSPCLFLSTLITPLLVAERQKSSGHEDATMSFLNVESIHS